VFDKRNRIPLEPSILKVDITKEELDRLMKVVRAYRKEHRKQKAKRKVKGGNE
jgi:hypothetical protein